jgi:hypothetical protein
MSVPQQTGQIFTRKPGLGHRLHHIVDVSGTPATDGQALVYNAVLGEWEPQTVTTDTTAIEAEIDAIQADLIDLDADIGTVSSGLSTHIANTSNPHAVTLAQTGNTVILDTSAPATDTNTADNLLDNMANRIKAITGESGWKDAPDTTLVTTAAHITNTSNPHSVTLVQTGNTVIDDTAAPATDTNTADVILDNLANRVKAITGETGWKSAPDTTLSTAHLHHIDTANPHAVTFGQVATYQKVTLASDFSLGTTVADVTGMSLTLAAIGTYLVFVDARTVYNATSTGVETYVNVGGTDGPAHVWESAISDTVIVSFVRVIVTTGTNTVIQLRALEKVSSNTVFDGTNAHMVSLRVA